MANHWKGCKCGLSSLLLPKCVSFGRLYFSKMVTIVPIPHALLQCDLATPPSGSRVQFSSSQIYTGLNDSLVTNRMWQKGYWMTSEPRSVEALQLSVSGGSSSRHTVKAPTTRRGHGGPLVNCSRWAQPSGHPSLGTTWVKKSSWKRSLQPQLSQLPLIKPLLSENPDTAEQTIPAVSSLNS